MVNFLESHTRTKWNYTTSIYNAKIRLRLHQLEVAVSLRFNLWLGCSWGNSATHTLMQVFSPSKCFQISVARSTRSCTWATVHSYESIVVYSGKMSQNKKKTYWRCSADLPHFTRFRMRNVVLIFLNNHENSNNVVQRSRPEQKSGKLSWATKHCDCVSQLWLVNWPTSFALWVLQGYGAMRKVAAQLIHLHIRDFVFGSICKQRSSFLG